MNILLVNVNIGLSYAWGGIESHSDALAALLHWRGHKVVMGCWKEGSVKVAGELSLPAKRIRIRNSGDVAAIIKLIRTCREENTDVIIANNGREYWPAAVAAVITGAKVIFIRHQTDRIRKTTRWLINNYVDAVVAVSDAVKGVILKNGVKAEKVDLIHNSISLKRFAPALIDRGEVRGEFGFSGADTVVGYVGKLDSGKGIFELLRAVSSLRTRRLSLKLIFVGDGKDKELLILETQRLSMTGNVIFAGVRRDMERMYAAMDIFVLPSTCEEAFGMVLIEAMAMGKPVIGTAVGGIPDIITNGVNGLIVTPGDEGAIADAISLYLGDIELRNKIAAEGRRTVEDLFSDSVMADKFEEVLYKAMRISPHVHSRNLKK